MASSNGDSTSTYEQQKREKKEAAMKRLIKVSEPEVEVRFAMGGSFGQVYINMMRIESFVPKRGLGPVESPQ